MGGEGNGVVLVFQCSFEILSLALELEERPRHEAPHSSQILDVLRLYAAQTLSDRRGIQIQAKNQ